MATLAQHNFPQSSLPSSPFDEDLDSLIPASTESTALLLQGVVSMEKIADSIEYTRGVTAGTDAATNIKSIESLFKPITEQRYAHWKRATELRAEKLKPFEAVKKKASLLVGAYDQAQETVRRAEEARLQAEENAQRKLLESARSKPSPMPSNSKRRAIKRARKLCSITPSRYLSTFLPFMPLQ